jgi:hypothetical protein
MNSNGRMITGVTPKVVFVDIDNTICMTTGLDYENAAPILDRIEVLNRMHDDGHGIVYYTARGAAQAKDLSNMTMDQLLAWGCRFSKLRMDKPIFDLLIDDRATSPRCFRGIKARYQLIHGTYQP